MKKMWLLLLVVMAAFVLTACQKEFAVDGDFTAYAVGVHNGPQVTMVTVSIEKGKVVGYNIDTRQGTVSQTAGTDTPDDTSDDTYTSAWNALTKKELGDDYGMVAHGGATLEWYEQAAALEAYWLEYGVSLDDVNAENGTDAVTGVTISVNEYFNLALEALDLARAGEFQALSCVNGSHGAELNTATMTVEGNKFSALKLDVLQSSVAAGTFAWNEKTKQELGFDYGLVSRGGATLEWFEQADTVTTYIQTNGWDANLQADANGEGGSLNGTTPIDDLAGVTIGTEEFYEVLGLLFDCPANDVVPA